MDRSFYIDLLEITVIGSLDKKIMMIKIFTKRLISKKTVLTGIIAVLLVCFIVGCSRQSNDGNRESSSEQNSDETVMSAMEEGIYRADIQLEGGTGRASVVSPAVLTITDGNAYVVIQWSSSHYDYMVVDDEKYFPVNTDGNSTFEIPVRAFDEPIPVIADTTAMSTPHEIEYTMTFHLVEDMQSGESAGQNSAEESAETEENIENGDAGEGAFGQKTDIVWKDAAGISQELIWDHSMELQYAKEFHADFYKDDYVLLQIAGDTEYLLIPEGKAVPKDISSDIVILQQPLHNIYLVASAVMDMFISMDALDTLRFSGLKQDSWYLEKAVQAMQSGDILYAGKYSAPDYEQILKEKCGLAIENTMIYHTPAVKEQLEKFGVPVLVDYSSYEEEPFARMEWIKLYGLLIGREEAADAAYEKQVSIFTALEKELQENGTDSGTEDAPTVAFFYITNSGQVNVRKSTDYLPRMIEMSGGSYIFQNLGAESSAASSTISMQMEEFYAATREADYIIYNSTTVGELRSMEDLIGKNPLLAKFKAVKDNRVYCTSKNLYQASMELGTIVGDLRHMLKGEESQMTYLFSLK